MRADAAEQMSDIAYGEALNDGIIFEVIELQVEVIDGSQRTTPVTSNALRYLLIDELEMGLTLKSSRTVLLEVTLPPRLL